MNEQESIAEFERLAEAAYAKMYEVPPRSVKDYYSAARRNLSHAIDAARFGSLADEVARLTHRLKEIENVYNNQFRGVGL